MSDTERLTQASAIALGAGRIQEHLRFVLDYLGRREIELHARIEDAEKNVEFLMGHNGARQIAQLEDRCAAIQTENDQLRQRVADLVIERDIAVKLAGDGTIRDIAQLAIEWGRAIQNLEQARKKTDDGEKKKGGESVYKANQAYTKIHLALKAALTLAEEPAITKP